MEMTRLRIPFQVRSGLRFYEQAHIKDVISFLRIIANPRDELAWKRAMGLYQGIGKSTSEKMAKIISTSPKPFLKLQSSEVKNVISKVGWGKFIRTITNLFNNNKLSPSELIRIILAGGYEDYLTLNFPNSYSRIEDIQQLAEYAEQYNTLDNFLAELSLLSNVEEDNVSIRNVSECRVILSTVHQAKGLEWRVVFIIWLVDGKFPDRHCLEKSDEKGGEEDLEEERRLFYVAITRAKEYLFLVYPLTSRGYSKTAPFIPRSRFLEEIDQHTYIAKDIFSSQEVIR